ncbi:hypothetical protein B0I37DRAFT_241098 [Chaetomium sp. MPI-CAGE-AT-0009]|nr:hypothetical protein B0I37DRAFT_241098 [Chaetomium sp. MPI-CAGE-AT-0009]
MDPVSTLSVVAAIINFTDTAHKLAQGLARFQVDADLENILKVLKIAKDITPNSANDDLNMIVDETTALVEDLHAIFMRKSSLSHSGSVSGRAAYAIKYFRLRKMERDLMPRVLSLGRRLEEMLADYVQRKNEERFDEIQASPRFAELDAYSRAAVTALLDQGKSNLTTEEETHYITSAGQLINRVLGLGENRESDREREASIRRNADDAVLGLLRYGAMDRRRDEIEPTFDSSFQWIFEKPVDDRWADFPEWMVDGSGLYVIVGKEASGKSTLMKYISTNTRTADYLTRWARPIPLVVTTFYFWRNGTRLEKSEEGLLRSLLYSVLCQQPHLMPIVFPSEWSMFYVSASNDKNPSSAGLGAWRVDHLRDAFRKLVRQDQAPLKLFFLIDGIDEYHHEDGKDNFTQIIEFFKNEIVTSANVKVLVSSRPLEAFDTLGIRPQLTLHEVNQEDIKSYVVKTLNNHDLFQTANELDKQHGDAIIRYILDNSNGVFLWAVLSVKTVISKLEDGETVAEILDDLKVQAMPMLDDFYQRMWSAIPSTVKRHASQTVQVMLARTDIIQSGPENGEGAPRLVDLALALGNPEETIKASVMKWPDSGTWVQTKCNKLAKDFMTTWPGFIHTTTTPADGGPDWSPTATIRYCHRSVPDYIRKKSASILADASESTLVFCPRTALLKSAVQQLKCVPPRTQRQYLWAFATMALLTANEIDSKHNPTESLDPRYVELLAQLDCTMQHHHDRLQKDSHGRYLKTKLQDPQGIVGVEDRRRDSKRIAKMHWSNFHFDPECSHPRSWGDSFLSLAIQFGLRNYVEAKLSEGNTTDKVLKSKKGRPLLDYALVPSAKIAPYHLVKPALIETLLDHGADPNEKFERRTCWERALQWQCETYPSAVNTTGATLDDARRVAEDRVKIFQLLIDKKADKRAFIVTAKGRKISARRVLEESFRPWPDEEPLQGFKQLMDSFPKDDVATSRGTFLFNATDNL